MHIIVKEIVIADFSSGSSPIQNFTQNGINCVLLRTPSYA